jgi:hypothetical protein
MARRSKSTLGLAPLFEERDSGATGGPPNVQGIAYQLDIAIYEACQFIPEALTTPLKNLFIMLESRAVNDEGITRWDFSITTPARHVEVKRNPGRKDVLDWLDRAKRAADGNATFALVYAGTSAKIIRSTEALIRIAKEAGGDSDRFQKLCRFDKVDDADSIALHLGDHAPVLLQQMEVRHLPEALVTNHVQFMARFLSPLRPAQAQDHQEYGREDFGVKAIEKAVWTAAGERLGKARIRGRVSIQQSNLGCCRRNSMLTIERSDK